MSLTESHKQAIGAYFRNDDPDPQGRYTGKTDLEVFDIATQENKVTVKETGTDYYIVELYQKEYDFRTEIKVPKQQ